MVERILGDMVKCAAQFIEEKKVYGRHQTSEWGVVSHISRLMSPTHTSLALVLFPVSFLTLVRHRLLIPVRAHTTQHTTTY